MVVLVVDVGGLLWNRRAMVNASDAAALAAAKSCVLPPTMDPTDPESRRPTTWAADNVQRVPRRPAPNILQMLRRAMRTPTTAT